MTKRCELTLIDERLLAEIELLGDVIVAVSLMPRPMTEAELDEALGLLQGSRASTKCSAALKT